MGVRPENVAGIPERGQRVVEVVERRLEVAPGGPYLDGLDGLIAVVRCELDAPVVSDDGDLTHDDIKRIVEVEEYRR